MVLNAASTQNILPIVIISQGAGAVASLNSIDTSANRPVTVQTGDSVMATVKVPITEFSGLYSP